MYLFLALSFPKLNKDSVFVRPRFDASQLTPFCPLSFASQPNQDQHHHQGLYRYLHLYRYLPIWSCSPRPPFERFRWLFRRTPLLRSCWCRRFRSLDFFPPSCIPDSSLRLSPSLSGLFSFRSSFCFSIFARLDFNLGRPPLLYFTCFGRLSTCITLFEPLP